jgi:Spy/CpxP family protein refolding chaperone
MGAGEGSRQIKEIESMSNRRFRIAAAALVIAAGAATVTAGSFEGEGPERRGRHGGVRRCLAAAELTEEQKQAARAAFEAARPAIESARGALRADHDALRALIDAENPDANAIGAQVMKIEADRKALRAEVAKAAESAAADLTDEQRSLLEGCMRGQGRP